MSSEVYQNRLVQVFCISSANYETVQFVSLCKSMMCFSPKGAEKRSFPKAIRSTKVLSRSCFLNFFSTCFFFPCLLMSSSATSTSLYDAMPRYLSIASVNQSVTQRTITIAKQQIIPRYRAATRRVGRVGGYLMQALHTFGYITVIT